MSIFASTVKRCNNAYPKKPAGKRTKKKNRPEAVIQDAIMKALNLMGYVVIRINSSVLRSIQTDMPVKSYLIYGLGKSSGMSDLLILRNDKAWVLEVKVSKGRLNENQKDVKKYFATKGVIYYVVHSAQEAIDIVEGRINEV